MPCEMAPLCGVVNRISRNTKEILERLFNRLWRGGRARRLSQPRRSEEWAIESKVDYLNPVGRRCLDSQSFGVGAPPKAQKIVLCAGQFVLRAAAMQEIGFQCELGAVSRYQANRLGRVTSMPIREDTHGLYVLLRPL